MTDQPLRTTQAILVLLAAAVAAAQNDPNAADVEHLVGALELHSGSVVADIGAGDAALKLPIARLVGPTGRVYATQLSGTPLDRLRKAVSGGDASNVEVVEAHALRTNLPGQCCDALFIRLVYHHFADPAAMNASLLQSLKPGGRLAIIDFAPEGPEATTPADRAGGKTHGGVTTETVVRELQEAGFVAATTELLQKRVFLVVVRKPGPQSQERIDLFCPPQEPRELPVFSSVSPVAKQRVEYPAGAR